MHKRSVKKKGTLVVCSPSNYYFQLHQFEALQKNRFSIQKLRIKGNDLYDIPEAFEANWKDLPKAWTMSAFRIESDYTTDRLHQVIKLICTRTTNTYPEVRFLLIKGWGDGKIVKHVPNGLYWTDSKLQPVSLELN